MEIPRNSDPLLQGTCESFHVHVLLQGSVKGFLKLTSALSQNRAQAFVLKWFVRNKQRDTKISCLKTLPVTGCSNGEKEDGAPLATTRLVGHAPKDPLFPTGIPPAGETLEVSHFV